jgi:adenylate kinase family enzyme
MKILVFGPSGSGKTYIAHALRQAGINAFDANEIKGLSAWYKQGKKVPAPSSADEALNEHYAFLWSKNFLEEFLAQFTEVYLFGGSGNLFDVIDLFDKVFFLKS